jgi:hypothetical protein
MDDFQARPAANRSLTLKSIVGSSAKSRIHAETLWAWIAMKDDIQALPAAQWAARGLLGHAGTLKATNTHTHTHTHTPASALSSGTPSP